MPKTESVFWDNVRHNKELSKAYQQRKTPRTKTEDTYSLWFGRSLKERGILGVDPHEVLEKIEELGVKPPSIRTLQRWAKQGLTPKPETKSAGRGKGRTSDYPDETPAEAAASFIVKSNWKLSPEEIAKIRRKALEIESGNYGRIDAYFSSLIMDGLGKNWFVVDSYDSTALENIDEENRKVFRWLELKHLFLAGVPQDQERHTILEVGADEIKVTPRKTK